MTRAIRFKTYVLIAFLFFSGCQAKYALVKQPLEDEGELYVYLQPFPQEAEQLRFDLLEISAVRTDGQEYPLTLSLHELNAGNMGRQRRAATGVLPPGTYSGLSIKIGKASLSRAGEGDVALLVPEVPVRTDSSFTIKRQKVLVLGLALNYSRSIKEGVRFIPSFAVASPSVPVTALAGYVTNAGSNDITVFDKKLGTVAYIIPTGKEPRGIALDPVRGLAYVALTGEDAVEVIDMKVAEIRTRIRLNVGDAPQDLLLTPDGRSLLAVNGGSNSVSFIDTNSFIELGRASTGMGPVYILYDVTTGRRAYVLNNISNSISIIDITTRSAVSVVPTETGPLQAQFNRKGDKLYLIFQGSPYLNVVDPVSFSTIKRVFVGGGISFIKVDTATDMIYVARKNSSEIAVYDPFSLMPSDFIRAVGGIMYMTIDGEENDLYLVSPDTGTILAVDLVSRKPVMDVDVGDDPYWVAITGGR